MTRRTMAERKRRADDRATRRDSLLVLLSRISRGIPVTAAEAALLRAHVEVELAESDDLRRTVGGQQTAIQRERARTTAAEAAIVEAEQRAEQAEQQLADIRTPKPIGGDHPMYALLGAMIGPGIDQVDARELVGDYFRAITHPEAHRVEPRRIPLPGIPACPATCPCRTAKESTP